MLHETHSAAHDEVNAGPRSQAEPPRLHGDVARAGFAASVLPVAAQTITTSADGLVAGEVKVPTWDGDMVAYRAMPATGTGFPWSSSCREIFGVHEHIKDVCRRFESLATSLSRRSSSPGRACDQDHRDPKIAK